MYCSAPATLSIRSFCRMVVMRVPGEGPKLVNNAVRARFVPPSKRSHEVY